MRKKGKSGQRLDKGKTLYEPRLAEKARKLILEAQLIKADGTLHYSKLAKLLEIPSATFSIWRNAGSQYYKPEFARALTEACDELLEGLQSGKIKQAMIKRALPYTRIKRTKERMVKGPKMPAMSSMSKKDLLFAAENLGLKVKKVLTCGVLKVKITAEVARQTKEVLVITKQEEERMHGDVAAAKLVLPNIGPIDKRWIPQEKREIEVNEETMKLMGLIDGSSKGKLPSRKESKDAK